MKPFLFLAALILMLVTGCVNQNIAARRSDIPWNQPRKSEATGALPASLVDQYNE